MAVLDIHGAKGQSSRHGIPPVDHQVCTQVCLHGQAGSLPQHERAYSCGPASESAV